MYKIGVIGGMGPLATVEFYKRVTLNTEAHSDREHIDMVVLSHATLPDRTSSILNHDEKTFLDSIKNDFNILNNLDVDAIAIPCNTSHYFYDDFIKLTDKNVINMVESTIKEIVKRGYKKACLFSTTGTYQTGVYHKYAKENGVEIVSLNDTIKNSVMNIIYKIKETNNTINKEFNDIIKTYCSEDAIGILACTELSLIELNEENKKMTIDALDVLVNETIKQSGKDRKK